MAEKLSQPNQSVEKMLNLIETMAQSREKMRLQDIAATTQLPTSTALRLVNTLVRNGYALQDNETLRYSLSMKFAKIGNMVSSNVSLRDISHPVLRSLSLRCGESCCLAIEENMQVVYVDVVDGPDGMLRIMQRIGKFAPLYCTGIGKLFLLDYEHDQLLRLAERGLPRLTPNTICSLTQLESELIVVRANGYSFDNEECEIGARCFAVPVHDHTGKIVAGISVSGPAHRMSNEHIEHIKKDVLAAGAKLSSALGYEEI